MGDFLIAAIFILILWAVLTTEQFMLASIVLYIILNIIKIDK